MTDLESIKSQLGEIVSRLDELHQAFPDGVQAHRAAHEAMIKAANAEESFWRELKRTIIEKNASLEQENARLRVEVSAAQNALVQASSQLARVQEKASEAAVAATEANVTTTTTTKASK